MLARDVALNRSRRTCKGGNIFKCQDVGYRKKGGLDLKV